MLCPSYKASLKPGTFTLPGKPQTMILEKIIGQFLVDKGLANSTDLCNFTLTSDDIEWEFSYSYTTGGLSLTINGETTTLFLTLKDTKVLTVTDLDICGVTYPTGSNIHSVLQAMISCASVNTENGISGNGTSASKIRLGGDLNQNTTIDGVLTYSMVWSDLTLFSVATEGPSALGSLIVSGAASNASRLQHTDKSDPTKTSVLTLDFNNDFGLRYTDSNGDVGFEVSPDASGTNSIIRLLTKGVRDGTVSVGQVIKLQNVNGEVEFANESGGGAIPGPYDDDADAAANSVSIGDPYYVSGANPWGMAEDFVRVRTT